MVTATLTVAGAIPLSVSAKTGRPVPPGHGQRAYRAQPLVQTETRAAPRAAAAAPPFGGTWTPLGPQPIANLDTYGPSAGRVTSLAANSHGTTVYAGAADGGVWKSTDSGQHWSPRTDAQATLAIGALAVDWSINPETIYAGTGEAHRCGDCLPGQGVLKSVDGGETWALVGQSTFTGSSFRFAAMTVDAGSHNVLAATDRGLYRSTDGGSSWNLVLAGGTNVVVKDPSTAGKYWAAQADWCKSEQGSIATSLDSGATWQQTGFAPSAQLSRIALDVGQSGVAYAGLAGCPGQLVGVQKTIDGGASWQPTATTPGDYFAEPGGQEHQGWYDNVVGVDPNDSTGNTAVFGGVTMLVTSDGGMTFNDVAKPYASGPLHPDFHAIAFFGHNRFYAGGDGGVSSTTDLGGTGTSGDWTNRNSTLNITQFYGGASVDLNHLAGGTQDNGTAGILPSGPAQPAWASLLSGDGTGTAMIPGSSTLFTSGTYLDVVQVDARFPSNPSHTEVAPCPTGVNDASCADPVGFVAPFVIDPSSSSASSARLYAATNRIYRTTSGGLPAGGTGTNGAWKVSSPDLTTGKSIDSLGDWINALGIGAGNTSGSLITGSWYGKVYLTTSGPTATPTTGWTDITGNLPGFNANNRTQNGWITAVALNPLDNTEAWATIGTLSGSRIWHTTNAGASPTVWSDISSTLPANLVVDSIAIDPIKPQNVYIGTDAGAMVCTNCGGSGFVDSWVPLGTGLPNVRVDQITLTQDDTELVAWTHGRGTWTMPRPYPTPAATLDPTRLDFGDVGIEATSPPMTVRLNSTGTGPLTVQNMATSGEFALVTAGSKPCPTLFPFPLAPGDFCTIGVTATPTTAGPRTGTLAVYDDGTTSPQMTTLVANGVYVWESLGGSLGSGPDASSWGSGRLDVFARNPDGNLIHKWFTGGSWHDWENLGGQIASDPTAVSWGPSRLDIFARSGSNNLIHKWYDGISWHDWESLGGQLTGGPDASSWEARRLDIFARGSGSGLIHKWYDGTSWHDWESLGGFLTSDPSAVSWSSHRLDIFSRAVGPGYDLIHKWYDGTSWHNWESLGGSWTSSPDVASWGQGRLDIFIRGTDGAMWHKWYDANGWHDPVSLGNQFSSDPGAVSWGSGRIDVFGRATDGTLLHLALSG